MKLNAKLFGYWRSSASYRVRIALELKGINVEHVAVNLKEAEHRDDAYIKVNVHKAVPSLQLADGLVITQSLAIMDYLEAAFPVFPLLPENPILSAQAKAFALAIAADIHPLQNLRVLQKVRKDYQLTDEQVQEWSRHWMRIGFAALEKTASLRKTHYLFCDSPGYAECVLIPQIYYARRFDLDMNKFPALSDVDSMCNELPAFKHAHPSVQTDAIAD